MGEWKREGSFYHRREKGLVAVVYQDGEFWRGSVVVGGDRVALVEYSSRELAIRGIDGAIGRAVWLRRFESDPPTLAKKDDDDGFDDYDKEADDD